VLSRGRQAVAPLYLLLCLVLGGSAQGIWANMVLQLVGLAIIAWAAMATEDEPLLEPARQLLLIASLGVAVIALQLIPLPGSLWSQIGPRHAIADGYRLLGISVPALPLSLTPYGTLDALLKLIPPIAILSAMLRLKAHRPVWMVSALIAGTLAGVVLGVLQVSNADPLTTPWYLYPETNYGLAVGFFANANHMATLLLMCIPFVAALVPAARTKNIQRFSAFVVLALGVGLILLVGIALNSSLAAYGLVLPVLAASALILIPAGGRLRLALAGVVAALAIAAVVVLSTSAVGGSAFNQSAATSVESRQEMLATTLKATKEFLPWGSGAGSFREVYRLFEDPNQVTSTYVIHAHNDYAEILLETGLLGLGVLMLFLAWWGAAVWRVWRSAEAGAFVRAASIASAAVLVHSLVDFPLRTAAVSACFAMCVALLADRRAPRVVDASDLRPTRHLVFR
jgi:O-antigen ligase